MPRYTKKHRKRNGGSGKGNPGKSTTQGTQKRGRPFGSKASTKEAPKSLPEHPGSGPKTKGRPSKEEINKARAASRKAAELAKAEVAAAAIAANALTGLNFPVLPSKQAKANAAAARKAKAEAEAKANAAANAAASRSLNPMATSWPPPTPKEIAFNRLNELYTQAAALNITKLISGQYYKFNKETDVIGLDCEMIATPDSPMTLASVSITRYNGTSDTFYVYYPDSEEVNYKVKYSGITKEILESKGLPFEAVHNYIKLELFGKRIVGHGLENDFNALKVNVPNSNIWDTTHIPYFMSTKKEIARNNDGNLILNKNGKKTYVEELNKSGNPLKNEYGNPIYRDQLNRDGNLIYMPRKLKNLAKLKLGSNIQESAAGHSAEEDALASLKLYKWAEEKKPDTIPDLNNTQLVAIESTA
jgi:DNA polymerase III epsilon subunit-like protein